MWAEIQGPLAVQRCNYKESIPTARLNRPELVEDGAPQDRLTPKFPLPATTRLVEWLVEWLVAWPVRSLVVRWSFETELSTANRKRGGFKCG